MRTTMLSKLQTLAAKDYRISVVLPVFSETDTVRIVADWLRQHLGERLLEIIIVISPRSSAPSRAVCEGLAAEDERIRVFVQQQNPGVGRAFREGYAHVRGNVVLSMDSDNEMELAAIPRMLDKLAEGNHGLVVGARWLPGGGFVGYSRAKRFLNWGFQQLFRWLFWTPLHDLTYGFKVLRAEVVHGIRWEASLHEIGCETTLKPIRLGVSAGEVPSVWTARTQGRSTNNFWRNFRYVAMAWRILVHGVACANEEAACHKDAIPPLARSASDGAKSPVAGAPG
ncbi:MAG TPA: glycosyltransferase family 2 protein [Gemmataceae bacterium]|nr:glycosyltransferase family 2 protein [Gemmataceae bacterium]